MSDVNREELKKLVKQAMREQMPTLLEEYKFEFVEPDWLKDVKTKLETQRKEQPETDSCPSCKAQVRKKDHYCHNCGEEFEDEESW